MNKSNHVVNQGVKFQLLSNDQCQDIHSAVLEVLENVGMSVQSPKALEVLKKGGAFVENDMVKIPSYLVEKAIRTAPSRVVLSDRKGNRQMALEGYNAYYGPGPTNVFIIDPYTGERRQPTSQDTVNSMRVVDGLPNIDFAMDFGSITDAPVPTNDIHLLKIMLENTTKPIVHWAKSLDNQKVQTELVTAVAGSLEEFQRSPFVCWFTTASSPLIQTKEALERLMYCAENLLPNCHVSAPMSGGTAPVTSAGTVVISIAEALFGVVLSQLVREGAPCFIGCVDGPVDMKTMIMSYGNPEFQLMNAAFAEMGHFYQLPTWGTAGCTDSKVVDQQAAIEATASVMMQALTGGNLIHDVGFMEGGTVNGLGQIVMDDEIIGYTRKIMKGLEVTKETLAVDVIKLTGPKGHFFDKQHTFNHFKELWAPSLLDKNRYDGWKAEGSLTLGDRINKKVIDLIENHRPDPLAPEVQEQLARIVAAADSN